MQCTDACVFPYPGGDSSLRRMALSARELGFDSIVAACPANGTYCGVEVIGMKVMGRTGAGAKEVSHAEPGQEGRAITVAHAGEYAANRALLRTGKIMVLRGIQWTPKNSFDHILSRMAAERGIAVDIDFSSLICERGSSRQRVIQRYADIVRLHRKFGFSLTLSSGARSVLGMRSPREMTVLGGLFGLEEDDTGRALGTVRQLLFPRSPVEVVE
ncbi:MAG TPA: RNase P subunit p30 family protein [Methanolinea sp.]|nr:RNase P subunit p30 family protein [Methanolinea sp.]HPC55911.1 RNase P subunit p30 family protein [Methanolinea sp.]HRS93151.1 RNase P subunit p30 family protein [Methanolinea sp.]HRU80441.1 RNase P subunit p30 family protein [Methanolinea sp.]